MNCGHRRAVSGDINAFFGLLHPRLKRIEPPPTQGRRRASSIFAVELSLPVLLPPTRGRWRASTPNQVVALLSGKGHHLLCKAGLRRLDQIGRDLLPVGQITYRQMAALQTWEKRAKTTRFVESRQDHPIGFELLERVLTSQKRACV